MITSKELVPVKLPNGAIMHVEAVVLGDDEEGAVELLSFDEVSNALAGITDAISVAVQKAKPKKASVELGFELAIESGKLTTLMVKGGDKANLKIALEWEG